MDILLQESAEDAWWWVNASRMEVACILAVMAAILVIYDLTMFPTISGGDSGELVGIACVGGVAHPPGYPLWLIMSRTFMAVLDLTPLNSKNMAWRLNFLSELLGAGASGALLCVSRLLGIEPRQTPGP